MKELESSDVKGSRHVAEAREDTCVQHVEAVITAMVQERAKQGGGSAL